MKIVLLGANGQVGWELQRALAPLGELCICDRQTGDLENLPSLQALLVRERPAIIVNAAAYTAVDKAEFDTARTRLVNAEAVAVLANYAAANKAWLVHYSTDYVFDGQALTPYLETAATAPLNVYGKTKLEGEHAIQASGCRHLILRTSWVYAARGRSFAKTMLRLAREREHFTVVADQFGVPTSAELIADVTSLCLARIASDPALADRANGVYHLVASGETSWHLYSQLVILEASRLGVALKATADQVLPISTDEYQAPAKRPANSRLNTDKLQSTFGLVLPHWEFHVRRMLHELIKQETL
jgi:dTDP-4-dehydrorhamnose reductase